MVTLATPADLRDLLGENATSLPDQLATLLLELATAEVQAAAGQDLVQVIDDQAAVMGTPSFWFALPQRPVTDVSSVEIDGEAVTDYKRFGARLWRSRGWSQHVYEPSVVSVTYTHGYAPGDPALGLARKLTLDLTAALHANPDGVTGGFSIDDYREQMVQTGGDSRTNLLPALSRRLLRRTYGGRAGLVRIG
ncbi:hypothetical protein CLV30_12577 [Haloactinopolyspora alba]|uniref:PhiE125 gp8 family phage protein n=1 Tax=Haloactinopolyspora alba TaxID=648780 RepID=A0A2P8DHK9_9ACTN|nr:hypothetical protein [Haloactinopolyspora alba]PSK96695.1 hypothetical protein CLV30_12577 [Haloactinopolyspora alba]